MLNREGGLMIRKISRLFLKPDMFYEAVREEGFREPLVFILLVSAVIAVFTPVVNLLGWPSTDTSSAFQAQILAWRLTQTYLIPRLGIWAYAVEALLIVLLTLLLAALLAMFIHLLYRLAGGKGPLLQGWKSVCYGVGPCVLLGWVPYWSLFLASWSLILQFYFGPKVLYRLPEGRALLILALVVGSTLLEFALAGTTVGFGPG
jgi:hypothetical protein